MALLYVMFLVFCQFLCDVLGKVWYLIVSIPDLCIIPHFKTDTKAPIKMHVNMK